MEGRIKVSSAGRMPAAVYAKMKEDYGWASKESLWKFAMWILIKIEQIEEVKNQQIIPGKW